MKLISYLILSSIAVFATIYYAYYVKKQFYPTMLFLVSSKTSLLIGGNLAFAVTLIFGKLIQSFYFGKLRDTEVELLIDKAKFMAIETCVALTIFRNEISATRFALFALLLFIKLMHRLCKSRLEYFEQISPVSIFMKTRMSFLLLTLIIVDGLGMYFAITRVITKGKSVMILFSFEFSLLMIYCVNLSVKFLLQLVDDCFDNGFTSKGLIVMLSELFCELVKFLTYVAFFGFIMVNYALPIHLLRDVWAAFHSLQRKVVGFMKYLQLTKNLQNRFPNATQEELLSAGNCLVCREDMAHGKKLPCGHVFHMECLRMWLQHQQSCPLCRAEIPNEGTNTPHINHDAAQEVVANQIPEQEANLNINVPNATNDSASGPTVHNMDNVANSGEYVLPVPTAPQIFPALYVVTVEELKVYKEPLSNSSVQRSLQMGCVFMASMRIIVSDGRHWLKIVDGWVCEESMNGGLCVVPFHVKIPTPEALRPQTQDTATENISSKVYSRRDYTQRVRNVIQFPTSNMEPLAVFDSTKRERLQELRDLQINIQEMSNSIHELSKAVIDSQKVLSKLIKEEIDSEAKENSKLMESIKLT